jgi:sodium/pantothenate symporter
METLPTSWAWYIVILTAALMFALSYWIYKRTHVASGEAFMVASRGVSWGLITASIAATELWAGSLLAAAEGVYTWGFLGLWAYALPTPLSFTIFALIARRARRLMPTGVTLSSWAKVRYGTSTHVLLSLIGIWIMAYFTMLQVIGGSVFFSGLFEVNYSLIAIVITVAFLGYYLIAGLWSSLITAFVQYFIVVLILLALVPAIYANLGGPGEIYSQIQQNATPQQMNIFRLDGIINFFLLQFLAYGAIATMSNYAWQRAYASEEGGMVKGLILGGWFWAPLAIVSALVGAAALALGLELDLATDAFPAVISQIFAPWVVITLAVAVLFAIYSTGSAYLGGIASLAISDFYEAYFQRNPNPQRSLFYLRLVSVVSAVVICGATIALQRVSLLFMILTAGAFVGAAFFPMVFGLFWKKTSALAANVGTLAALILASSLLLLTDASQPLAYALGLSASLILTVVISLIKPANFDFDALRRQNEERLEKASIEPRAQ